MKIYIDTDEKIIKIDSDVALKELISLLEEFDPSGYVEYKIRPMNKYFDNDTNAVWQYWVMPPTGTGV